MRRPISIKQLTLILVYTDFRFRFRSVIYPTIIIIIKSDHPVNVPSKSIISLQHSVYGR